jgi:hypothetical protein
MDKSSNASPAVNTSSSSAAAASTDKTINVMLRPFSFLSTPALITLIAYVVLSLIVILPFDIPVRDERTGIVTVVPYNFVERLLILLLLALPIALSIYSINCMVVGKCELLSYVIAFITVIWVALTVVLSFAMTFSSKKQQQQPQHAR